MNQKTREKALENYKKIESKLDEIAEEYAGNLDDNGYPAHIAGAYNLIDVLRRKNEELKMKGFNGRLESKESLNDLTKEQLIDMFWDYQSNTDKLLEEIFASQENYEKVKSFYYIVKFAFNKENKNDK